MNSQSLFKHQADYAIKPSPTDDVLRGTLGDIYSAIECRLQEVVPLPKMENDFLGHVMHSGVLAPGKRFRPALMMLARKALGGQQSCVLDLACAVEMVHTASLFLDDMPCMDNAKTRRGRPAAHIQYGEDMAMLGAVALLSEALRLVASVGYLPAELQTRLLIVLCSAVGPQGLAKGQSMDLHHGTAARNERAIGDVNGQKTGILFAAALEMVALACSASNQARAALKAATIEIGHAFQLRDDLEDILDVSAKPIKDRLKDAGKPKLVSMLGPDAVQRRIRQHLADAVLHLRVGLPQNSEVVAFILEAFCVTPYELALENTRPDSAVVGRQQQWRFVSG